MSDTFFPDADANIQSHIDNNSDRRILIHFQVEPATFDVSDIEPSSPSYTCSVSWIWEWADESKERLFWHGSDMVEKHNYELCCEHDPAAELVEQRPRSPYVAADNTFKLIQEALHDCNSHHECQRKLYGVSNDRRRPSRLIDVGSIKDEHVHLTSADDTIQYVALSYCWGTDDSMKLTGTNIENWKKLICLSWLPRTLQDAIICTRRLSLRYLWVDRLCIIQDDEMDKGTEIAAMAQIFQGACLTVSASSTKSSGEGFLKTKEEVHATIPRSWVDLPYLSSTGARGLATLKLSEFCEDFNMPNTKAVDSRAWTMQEQMLSSRLLHFCTFHVVWKCKEQERRGTNDSIEQPEPSWSRDRKVGPVGSNLDKWNDIVRNYTERKLSCSADKLVALSAVAQMYNSIQSFPTTQSNELLIQPKNSVLEDKATSYLAGLWRHEMPFALCWWRPFDNETQFRPVPPRAPSWSWASVDGTILYYDRYCRMSVTVLECDVVFNTPLQEYGAVSSGRLRLRGRLKQGPHGRKTPEDHIHHFPDALDDPSIDLDATTSVFALHMGDSREVFWSGNSVGPFGLLLLPLDSSTFRRVGFFQADFDLGFNDCPLQDIIIV